MKEYDIVVIGAGNGGISASVALSQQGKKVLVLEQHNLPGGCASSFVRGRFEFDVSLHSMDYYNAFKPVFTDAMGLKARFLPMPHEMDYVVCKGGKVMRDFYHFGMRRSMQRDAENLPRFKSGIRPDADGCRA